MTQNENPHFKTVDFYIIVCRDIIGMQSKSASFIVNKPAQPGMDGE